MARPRQFDENEVLRRALGIFQQRGYDATSVQDLVEGLGINRASLYDTFGDKHALYLEALRRYQQEQSGFIAQHLSQPRPAAQLLRELLEGTTQAATAEAGRLGCFMVNAGVERGPADPVVAGMVCQNQHFVEDCLRQVIERGQTTGELSRRQDAATQARFLFVTITGLRALGRTGLDPAALPALVDVAMRAIT